MMMTRPLATTPSIVSRCHAQPASLVRKARGALVEVQRRFGGRAPRAVVGGQFIVGAGAETVFEVFAAADSENLVRESARAGSAMAIRSRIYERWPFIARLPGEYAGSALTGLTDNSAAR